MTTCLALVIALMIAAGATSPAVVQSGAISGTVVSADPRAEPVSRAIVTLTGGNIPNNLSAVTDEHGRFQFLNLAPGRYQAMVTKPAYLPTAFGATRPGRPGTSILVTAGQTADLRIALTRGAVITGEVRDQFGAPVPGAQVMVLRASAIHEGPPSTPLESLTTDDRGIYRAFGLMPDEYVIGASLPLSIALIGEIHQLTRETIDTQLRSLSQAGGARDPAATFVPPPTASFAPVFYPGTPIAANAVRIRVAAGEERSGVDIPMAPVKTARVSGVLHGGEIQPQFARPQLIPIGPTQFQAGILRALPTGPTQDGVFSFSNVTPGRYTVLFRTGSLSMPYFFAATEVVVDGVDITGLALALRPAPTISGRVVFDATTLKPPENHEVLRILLTGTMAGSPMGANALALGMSPPIQAWARYDGTFRIPGVVPGSYSMSTSLAGWWLRSVVIGGRDILDVPLEIDGSMTEIGDAVITLSDRRSELSGTLTTAGGQPASEFVVIAYPVERAYWRPGSRRIRSVRPGSDGAFMVQELPPGEYFVAAVTDADPGEWQQPSFLEQLVSSSVKVSIAEGQKARQDLRIAR